MFQTQADKPIGLRKLDVKMPKILCQRILALLYKTKKGISIVEDLRQLYGTVILKAASLNTQSGNGNLKKNEPLYCSVQNNNDKKFGKKLFLSRRIKQSQILKWPKIFYMRKSDAPQRKFRSTVEGRNSSRESFSL